MLKNFLTGYMEGAYPQGVDDILLRIGKYSKSLFSYEGKVDHINQGYDLNENMDRQISVSEQSKASVKGEELFFLIYLTNYLKKSFNKENETINILDIGTGFGVSSLCFASVSKKIEVVSLEGCPNITSFTRKYQKENSEIPNLPNIIHGNFEESFLILKSKFDIVFIDGDNIPEKFEEYFHFIYENLLSEKGIIIVRDIHGTQKGKENKKTLFNSWEILIEQYKDIFNFYDLAYLPNIPVEFGIVERN
jgi:hypothetical protein